MKSRYVLASEAAGDLVEIWGYIKRQSSLEMAEQVESVIRDRLVFLAAIPLLEISEKTSPSKP